MNCLLSIRQTLQTCLFTLSLLLPLTSFAQGEDASGPVGKDPVHNIETSPLGFLGGLYPISYAYVTGKNSFGAIGAPIYSFSSAAEISGYMGGIFYSRMFDRFENDPNFIGVALTYSRQEGEIDVNFNSPYKAGLEATLGSLSLFYGNSYVWKNGFTMSWRLGIAYPFIWDYQWENLNNKDDDDFADDTESYEAISKIFTYILGGSGFGVGWSF